MIQEEAVALALQFVEAEGLEVGPIGLVKYWTGAEYGTEVSVAPHWSIHFPYNGPPVEELPEEQRCMHPAPDEDMIVDVDDATGTARLMSWL